LLVTFRQLGEVAVLAAEMFDIAQKYNKNPKVRYKHRTRHFAKLLVIGCFFWSVLKNKILTIKYK
jgi:hypothetical protein